MDEIDILLGKLEDLIKSGRRQLISGGCIVDGDACLRCLSQIRSSLPQSLSEARIVMQDRAKILDEARRESEAVVKRAEMRARESASRDEIVKIAQQEADDLKRDAAQYANELLDATYKNLDSMMGRTEYYLKQAAESVSVGRQETQNKMSGK